MLLFGELILSFLWSIHLVISRILILCILACGESLSISFPSFCYGGVSVSSSSESTHFPSGSHLNSMVYFIYLFCNNLYSSLFGYPCEVIKEFLCQFEYFFQGCVLCGRHLYDNGIIHKIEPCLMEGIPLYAEFKERYMACLLETY